MAQLIVVGHDGDRLRFFDVSQVTAETLERAVPMLDKRETSYYEAATNNGFNVVQRFIYAVTAQNTQRTCNLLHDLGF